MKKSDSEFLDIIGAVVDVASEVIRMYEDEDFESIPDAAYSGEQLAESLSQFPVDNEDATGFEGLFDDIKYGFRGVKLSAKESDMDKLGDSIDQLGRDVSDLEDLSRGIA